MGGDARAHRARRSLFHPMHDVFAQHVRVLRAFGLKASYQSVKKNSRPLFPSLYAPAKQFILSPKKNISDPLIPFSVVRHPLFRIGPTQRRLASCVRRPYPDEGCMSASLVERRTKPLFIRGRGHLPRVHHAGLVAALLEPLAAHRPRQAVVRNVTCPPLHLA